MQVRANWIGWVLGITGVLVATIALIATDRFVKVSTILHGYIDLLTWPVVTLIIVMRFGKDVYQLLSEGRVRITVSSLEFETTSTVLEASITESLHGKKLTEAQWNWLSRLQTEGRTAVNNQDKIDLRPLRDAALVRAYPEGQLADATHVDINSLGRLLVKARTAQRI
jgi:hypothetical protein